MHFILVIIGIGLLIGLLFRSKGDSLLDTIQSGCGILLVLIVLIILFLFSFKFLIPISLKNKSLLN